MSCRGRVAERQTQFPPFAMCFRLPASGSFISAAAPVPIDGTRQNGLLFFNKRRMLESQGDMVAHTGGQAASTGLAFAARSRRIAMTDASQSAPAAMNPANLLPVGVPTRKPTSAAMINADPRT